MYNSLQLLAHAFQDQYRVSFCLLSEDAEHADLILSLSDDSGVVAKRSVTAAQRSSPERLHNLIQSIRLGIAIDQRQDPTQTLAALNIRQA